MARHVCAGMETITGEGGSDMKKAWLKRVLVFATILTVALCASGTRADDGKATNGVYVSLSGAFVLPLDSDVTYMPHEDLQIDGKMILEKGFGGMAALGYEFESGWRTELEIGYRSIDAKELNSIDVKGFRPSQGFQPSPCISAQIRRMGSICSAPSTARPLKPSLKASRVSRTK